MAADFVRAAVHATGDLDPAAILESFQNREKLGESRPAVSLRFCCTRCQLKVLEPRLVIERLGLLMTCFNLQLPISFDPSAGNLRRCQSMACYYQETEQPEGQLVVAASPKGRACLSSPFYS